MRVYVWLQELIISLKGAFISLATKLQTVSKYRTVHIPKRLKADIRNSKLGGYVEDIWT